MVCDSFEIRKLFTKKCSSDIFKILPKVNFIKSRTWQNLKWKMWPETYYENFMFIEFETHLT